jgi:hypothetical protein
MAAKGVLIARGTDGAPVAVPNPFNPSTPRGQLPGGPCVPPPGPGTGGFAG